jgi:hypothetical protein
MGAGTERQSGTRLLLNITIRLLSVAADRKLRSQFFWQPQVGVAKLGRTLAFSDVTLTSDGAAEPAARASTVYAILG